ncbi:MAG: hypothetical protein ABWZ02_07805 [Nakamurella sp.]
MRIATTVIGSLTAAYGVLELVKPDILAKQTEMSVAHPEIAQRLRLVSRLMGGRDIISGTALAFARTPGQRRVAAGIRVAFDVIDGIALSAALPQPAPKGKILGITGGWALLSAASVVIAERSKR